MGDAAAFQSVQRHCGKDRITRILRHRDAAGALNVADAVGAVAVAS